MAKRTLEELEEAFAKWERIRGSEMPGGPLTAAKWLIKHDDEFINDMLLFMEGKL